VEDGSNLRVSPSKEKGELTIYLVALARERRRAGDVHE